MISSSFEGRNKGLILYFFSDCLTWWVGYIKEKRCMQLSGVQNIKMWNDFPGLSPPPCMLFSFLFLSRLSLPVYCPPTKTRRNRLVRLVVFSSFQGQGRNAPGIVTTSLFSYLGERSLPSGSNVRFPERGRNGGEPAGGADETRPGRGRQPEALPQVLHPTARRDHLRKGGGSQRADRQVIDSAF